MIERDEVRYIISLLNIFKYSDIEDLRISEELWSSSLKKALNNINSDKFISESLKYVENLYYLKPDLFDEEFDLNNFIEKGTCFLTATPFDGFDKRAPFYYFITSYIEKKTIDLTSLDSDIIKKFLLKIIPMLDIYYGTPSVKKTLNVFACLWVFMDEEIENELLNQIILEYKSHYYKRSAIEEFISKGLLNSENQIKWNKFLADYNN